MAYVPKETYVAMKLPEGTMFPYGTKFIPPHTSTFNLTPNGWLIPLAPDNEDDYYRLQELGASSYELKAYPIQVDIRGDDGTVRTLQYGQLTPYHTMDGHTVHNDRYSVAIDPDSPHGYIHLQAREYDFVRYNLREGVRQTIPSQQIEDSIYLRTKEYNISPERAREAVLGEPATVASYYPDNGYPYHDIKDAFGKGVQCQFDTRQPNTMVLQTERKINDMPLGLIVKSYEKDGMSVVPVVYDPPSGQLIRPLTQDEINANAELLTGIQHAVVAHSGLINECARNGNDNLLQTRIDDEVRWDLEDEIEQAAPAEVDTDFCPGFPNNKYHYVFRKDIRAIDASDGVVVPHGPKTPEITTADGLKMEWVLNGHYYPDQNSYLYLVTVEKDGTLHNSTIDEIMTSDAPDWLKETYQRRIDSRSNPADAQTELKDMMLRRMTVSGAITDDKTMCDQIYVFPITTDSVSLTVQKQALDIPLHEKLSLAVRDCCIINEDGTKGEPHRELRLLNKDGMRIDMPIPDTLAYTDNRGLPQTLSKADAIQVVQDCIKQYAGDKMPVHDCDYTPCTPSDMLKNHASIELPHRSWPYTFSVGPLSSNNKEQVCRINLQAAINGNPRNMDYPIVRVEQNGQSYAPCILSSDYPDFEYRSPRATHHVLTVGDKQPSKCTLPVNAVKEYMNSVAEYMAHKANVKAYHCMNDAKDIDVTISRHGDTAMVSFQFPGAEKPVTLHGELKWQEGNPCIRFELNTLDQYMVELMSGERVPMYAPADVEVGTSILEMQMQAAIEQHRDELYKEFPELNGPSLGIGEDR